MSDFKDVNQETDKQKIFNFLNLANKGVSLDSETGKECKPLTAWMRSNGDNGELFYVNGEGKKLCKVVINQKDVLDVFNLTINPSMGYKHWEPQVQKKLKDVFNLDFNHGSGLPQTWDKINSVGVIKEEQPRFSL